MTNPDVFNARLQNERTSIYGRRVSLSLTLACLASGSLLAGAPVPQDSRDAQQPPAFRSSVKVMSEVRQALASSEALTAVPVTVVVTPYKTNARGSLLVVVVEIPGSGLDLTRTDQSMTRQLQVALVTVPGEQISGREYTYDLTLKASALGLLARDGVRVMSLLQLRPGEYRLHVAAGTRGGRFGKVIHDLTVPDLTGGPLMMSGVSLTTAAAADVPTLDSEGVPGTALPAPPSSQREFTREDTLMLYAEVYENVWRTGSNHAITVTTELRDASGQVIRTTSERRSSEAPRLTNGGHGFLARLALQDVPPGAYLVQVRAHSDQGAPHAVTSEVPILVR